VASSNKLKALRNKCNVTVRDVEQASRRIAEAKGDKNYCVSNSWLAQLENGISAPNIWTIFSLCAIYRVTIRDFLQLYNVDVDEIEQYTFVANPHLTLLHPHADGSAQTANEDKQHVMYAHIGSADYTMYPLIRPGAVVEIDTSQIKLHANSWHNEFERPIFFIELRDGYACGWCEVQGNQLLVIPHHSSPATIRRFIYPRDAEIVGRVVSYNTPCVDAAPEVKGRLLGIASRSRSTHNSSDSPNPSKSATRLVSQAE
jgi:transcriptional regulator with XRE-family HTH domain